MVLYDKIGGHAGFVLVAAGLYGNRADDLRRVVGGRPARHLITCACGHDVRMLEPAEAAASSCIAAVSGLIGAAGRESFDPRF